MGEAMVVISCGFEEDQGVGRPGFDEDRRAVDIAAFNAQGSRSIAWWPMYPGVEPGDVVLIRLAPHKNVPFGKRKPNGVPIIDAARDYANCDDPSLPQHPLVREGGPSEIFTGGYQGLGMIMPSGFVAARADGRRLITGTVGHVTFFPRWLDVDDLLASIPTSRRDELRFFLSSPDDSCQKRLEEGRYRLDPDAATALLDGLSSSAAALFESGGRLFRADLAALRACARVVRSGHSSDHVAALCAPDRWFEADDRVETQDGLGRLVVRDHLLDRRVAPQVPEWGPGKHPQVFLREMLSTAGEVVSEAEGRAVSVLVGDLADGEQVSAVLQDDIDHGRPGGVVAELLGIPAEAQAASTVRLRDVVLSLGDVGIDVPIWVISSIANAERSDYPRSEVELHPRICLVARLPDDGIAVEPYVETVVARVFEALHRTYGGVYGRVRGDGGWTPPATDGYTELDSASVERPRSISRELRERRTSPNEAELHKMSVQLTNLFARSDRLHASLDAVHDALPSAADDVRRSTPASGTLDAWLEAAVSPLADLEVALAEALERVNGLTGRLRDAFTSANAHETRKLLDQTDDAKRAAITAGGVALILAALALYAGAAAIPGSGAGTLFSPNLKAVAWTAVALAVAIGYGFAVARAALSPSGDWSDRRFNAIAALVLLAAGVLLAVLALIDVLNGDWRVVGVAAATLLMLGAGLLGAQRIDIRGDDPAGRRVDAGDESVGRM